ncbi:uncharacterized protein LOC126818369 [Patella vulgata]|uniref:uncharacterized protein LOC126818369 n=1 Tax=Patella vulgata TaxID=6465 RepID=UPI0021806924|nr:uncharacterized protein LOC126818369 [Patella vulgata]
MPKLGRRSERSGFELIQVPLSLPPQDGPFGTDYTPVFASRIVGGVHVPVLEKPYKVAGDINRSSHTEPLYPLAEKPNYIDPKVLREYSKKFPTNRAYPEQSFFGLPTTYSKRPDSKDINRKYPTLPPINANRVRNMDMSTVFEPEPWTKKYKYNDGLLSSKGSEKNTNSKMDEVDQKEDKPLFYDPRNKASLQQAPSLISPRNAYEIRSDQRKSLEHHSPSPPPAPATVHRNIREELLKYLPRNEFLPEKTIRLNDDDEWELLKILGQELEGEDPLKLRHVYISITKNGDKQLCGWCSYKSLVYALQDYKVNISSDILRITAGLFIDPDREPQNVNYEKFLSFVGAALKNFGKSPRAGRYSPNDFTLIEDDRPEYFDVKSISPRAQSMEHIFNDREVTKLLRMTEMQLNNQGFRIDFEKLIADFQLADREFRETLSEHQIKEICYACHLPLTESLMKHILHRCQDLNKDGQYNWIKFVYFLERVQPSKTGLYIPRGKRPLDYAKHVPQPTTEWPKPKSPGLQPPLWRREEVVKSKTPERIQLHGPQSDRGEVQGSRMDIDRMDRELKELEKNYEVMKRNLKADDSSPWFKRFMELANALYGQDVSNSGLLPYDDVWNWTRLHNEACNLNIPDYVISKALGEASQSGKVNIHYFLTKLGNRDW